MAIGRVTTSDGARTGLKSTVLGMAAVLVLASSGLAADGATAPSEAPASPAPSNRISVRIAQALDNDPEAIFSFIRDHVRYEPYSGVLRGAQGAYYGRAGNSVDQSLLLARLLDGAAVTTRFATGSIDDETAAALLASGTADESALREQQAMALFGRLPGDDDTLPSLPRAVEYAPIYQAGQAEDAEAWARAELIDTIALIGTAIDEAGLDIEGGFSQVPDDERDRHMWVQALVGNAWIDLDPSLPTASFGDAIAELSETMDEVPEDRRHMISLAVVAESLKDGVLVEEELLSFVGPADELSDSSITISNVGSEAVPQLTRAFEQVLGVVTYNPLLIIDERVLAGGRMRFKDPAGDEAGGLGGGFFETGAATQETTAEWIELMVDSPEEDPVTVRRMMFDRIGDTARKAGSYDIDALPALEAVVDESGETKPAPLLTTWWLDISTGMPSLRSRSIDLAGDDPRHLVVIPYAHHLLNSLAGLDLSVPIGARPFVDAPNVSGVTVAVKQGPDGQPMFESAIDIWHRSRGVATVPGGAVVDGPAAIPGVLAHVTERMMGGDAATSDVGHGSISVGAVFDAVSEQGVAIRAIDASAPLEELPYPSEARAHLERSLADGWVAIVPERPVAVGGTERVGWWLVDPATGRVADQMDDGRGGFSEYTVAELGVIAFAAIGAATIFGLAAQSFLEFFTAMQWSSATNTLGDQLEF